MAQLVVETERCPLILDRVLEIIRERDVLPFTITAKRDLRVQMIEMEVSAPEQQPALALLQDIRRLANVRFARFHYPSEPPFEASTSAKL
ncbi:hypothetical protein ATM17_18160 [Sphingopyxis macrogoltabida]|uniref:ACT domain-containing protein n=1 Tax=Sphingopyxis macrogoltabida TaxID=33050 RepID=A0AAC9AW59_SPHMC|nr:hypothetical protein LH19_17590 [Sphingopyxis macrogoltabida]AMU90946.1 hypothetical protein ATM17_18160 [Sphingopyxis macrogoltabida]